MTLTEQWKKGELEKHKRYYVRDGEKIFTSYLDEHNCFLQSREEDTYQEYEEYTTYCDEVLAPVPSYEEYNRLKEVERKKGKLVNVNYKIKQENQQLRKWCEEFNALDVVKENQQLKDLLKECLDVFSNHVSPFYSYCQWQKYPCVDTEDFYQDTKAVCKIIDEIDNAIGEKK